MPPGYTAPPFPSLWVPAEDPAQNGSFLYHLVDIWRFTLLWTLIVYGAFHVVAGAYAVFTQRENLKYVWAVPVAFAIVAGIESLLAGSVVGLM